jgi:hypothetical protein
MTEYIPFLTQVGTYGEQLRNIGAYIVEKKTLDDTEIRSVIENMGKLAAGALESFQATQVDDQLQLPNYANEADNQVMADFVTAWSNSVQLTVKAAEELTADADHTQLEATFNKVFMATRFTNVLYKQNVEFQESIHD